MSADIGLLSVVTPTIKCKYSAIQFHFHSPSEHLILGTSFPLEMHIVHTMAEGAPSDYIYTKAVVAVVFDDSKDIPSPFIESLHADAPGTACNVDLQGFISTIPKRLFHYQGSLTTPPCSEVVNWYSRSLF